MEKISLISRVRAGDRKAFDELCRKYYAMLVSYARLFLRDDWAEDVVQDVFYNVWQRRETLDDSNSLYKYLLRSVYNRSLNYLDKNRRAGEYGAYYRERIAALGSSYYAPDNSPVVQKLYNDDLRASLDAAIESLPPKCREGFRLSYIEDLSNREIGEQLGISPRTVENHMYAALKQLRRKLSKEQLLLLLSRRDRRTSPTHIAWAYRCFYRIYRDLSLPSASATFFQFPVSGLSGSAVCIYEHRLNYSTDGSDISEGAFSRRPHPHLQRCHKFDI